MSGIVTHIGDLRRVRISQSEADVGIQPQKGLWMTFDTETGVLQIGQEDNSNSILACGNMVDAFFTALRDMLGRN
jgi:hypothetical protein